jgi:hypothetical protein
MVVVLSCFEAIVTNEDVFTLLAFKAEPKSRKCFLAKRAYELVFELFLIL